MPSTALFRSLVATLALAVAAVPAAGQSQTSERARREAEVQARQKEEQARQEEQRARIEHEVQSELEERMREAEREMREAQRAMERAARRVVELHARQRDAERSVASYVVFGGRARLGVVVDPRGDPKTDSIGARIVAVTPGGPAEEAGLKAGDVITKINGERLAERRADEDIDEDESRPVNRLLEIVGDLEDGDTVTVEYRRGRTTQTVTLQARSRHSPEVGVLLDKDLVLPVIPEIPVIHEVGSSVSPVISRLRRSMASLWLEHHARELEMVPLNPALGRYFGASEGILVLNAPRECELKLESGDVITAIDGRTPTSPSKVLRILRSYEPGETVTIEILRDHDPLTLTVDVPEGSARLRVPLGRDHAWIPVVEAPARGR